MNERDIFLSAIEITDPGERAAFVKQACGADADLLNQVEELLKSHEQTSQFLETPAAAADSAIEQTVLSDDFEGDNDSERSNGEEEFRRYLQPTTRPGWLGRLAHYEIEEIIGRGAFGIVAKAFDEKLHRVVAIKLMNPELAATSPPRKRFLREARTAAAVSHENIVAIHSVEEDPIPYLVMEYIPGQTLQQRLNEQGPLDLNDILEIGRQIAAGLAAAHAVNLIHRDIKPSNILLTDGPNERVKISDFGLARAVDDASLTSSGLIAGTPMYMAPEQARGETLDHRADLFSLGSVLYQMTSGRPPFRAGNTVAVLKRVCDDAPRPISDIIGGTPEWLSSIISRLMEKDRENRLQSAQEVADLLAACRRDIDQDRKPVSVASTAVSPSGRVKQKNNTDQTAVKGVMIGMVMMLAAFIFVMVISPRLARWFDTPIPRLPQTENVGGLRFDGRDDWVEVTGLDWNYPQFTIEAFVTSAAGSDNGTIAFLGSGKGDDEEWMSLFDGPQVGPDKRISGAAVHGKTAYQNAYGPFAGGQRQHRALVFDGRHLHYYINGIWQGERKAEPHEGLQWKMKELRIGCDGSGRRFFQGVIDQLKISRVAKYSQNFEVTSDFTSDEQTLALYRFEENEGELLKDLSGNGHDGRIVGAKWSQNSVPAIPSTESLASFENDRFVAEWVLTRGGRVGLRTVEDSGTTSGNLAVTSLDQLPMQRFAVFQITLDTERIDDLAALKKFQWLPDLRYLQLRRGECSPELLEEISKCRGLVHLQLLGKIDTDALRKLAAIDSLRGLSLYIADEKGVNDNWQALVHLESLRELQLLGSPDALGLEELSRQLALSPSPRYLHTLSVVDKQSRSISEERIQRLQSARPGLRVLAGLPTQGEQNESVNTFVALGRDPVAAALRELALRGFHFKGRDFQLKTLDLTNEGAYDVAYRVDDIIAPEGHAFTLRDCELLVAVNRGAEVIVARRTTNADLLVKTLVMHSCVPNSLLSLDQSDLTDAGLAMLVFDDGRNCAFGLNQTLITESEVRQFKGRVPTCLVKSDFGVFDYEHSFPREDNSPPQRKPNSYSWPQDQPSPAIAPFDTEQAKAHQEAWAEYLKVPVEYENSIGMKFRLIPPGEFLMGSTPEEIAAALQVAGEDEVWQERIKSEGPQHKVILTQPVYVGVTEVTQTQYEQVRGTNPSDFSATGKQKDLVANLETGNHPVEMVSWNDAAEFCVKLSQQEKLKPFYFRSDETVTPLDGTGYRLPTEAEWESACRAGTTTRYWSGNEDQDLVSAGWFASNSGDRTHAAGELRANPFGLWDMHGNVWEWVQDSWDPGFYGNSEGDAAIDPSSSFSASSQRVFRGGHWFSNPFYCRSSPRNTNHWTRRSHIIGFRVVLPVGAVREQQSATRSPVDFVDLISLTRPGKTFCPKRSVEHRSGRAPEPVCRTEVLGYRDPLLSTGRI
ncbi:MAG: SUMF1/EgtB/PvdO family nonheme iron enzyme [Planctomycetaceae bacterium]